MIMSTNTTEPPLTNAVQAAVITHRHPAGRHDHPVQPANLGGHRLQRGNRLCGQGVRAVEAASGSPTDAWVMMPIPRGERW